MISRLKFITTIVLSFVTVFVTSAQSKKLTIVQGSVNKEFVNKVFLYGVADGELYEYASIRLSGNNSFAFALNDVSEGFYYLGDNLKGRAVYYRFYLKQGDEVYINVNNEKYGLEGKSAENKLLAQWEGLFSEIAIPSLQFWNSSETYVTFFPKLEGLLPKAYEFKKMIKTPNKKFNSLLSFVVDNDIEFAATNFILTPRSAHPSKEEFPDYYSTIIRKDKYCDTRVLSLGDAMQRLSRYTVFNSLHGDTSIAEKNYLKRAVNSICNDTLKGIYVVSNLSRYKTLENLHAAVAPFKDYILTDSAQAKYLRYETGLATYAKGEKAFNFSYPDINGDTVTLASLRGKIVLVDTWATWCAPCRVEIPHLKKLEHELKDKDIAFVSLSVDVEKDEEKWKKFVQKESLGGIQLYAKGFSEFAQYYKISSIPRFLIFDKEGRIVTIDSPRPSDPALKDMLLQLAGE